MGKRRLREGDRQLYCPLDFTGLNAAGTNIYPFWRTVQHDFDFLDIRAPFSFSFDIGVADLETSSFTFIANHTNFSHCLDLPAL